MAGGNKEIPVDATVIAPTSENLKQHAEFTGAGPAQGPVGCGRKTVREAPETGTTCARKLAGVASAETIRHSSS